MIFRRKNRGKATENLSPGKKAWRKFWRDPLAVFGVAVIFIAVVIAIGGSWLRPDSTKDAVNAIPSISKASPGFSVTILSERKNEVYEQPGFFGRLFFGGTVAEYKEWAIREDYELDGFYIRFREYSDRSAGTIEVKHLANILYPLELDNKYITEGDQVTFFVVGEGKVTRTIDELFAEFEEQSVSQRTYWLGTDDQGRDMASRLMGGTIVSLMVGFIAVLISIVLGVSLGSIAGYFRGWVDDAIMWLINVIWSVPPLLFVIAFTLAIGKGVETVFIAVGLTMWVEVARIVRGQVISVREKEFIEAGRALGYSSFRIILKHVLPNVLGPVIVMSAANFASAILIEAGLSYLGLGAQPPEPSWGEMIARYQSYITNESEAFLAVLPGVCIMILVLAFMLVGNGIRDALDSHATGDIPQSGA